MPAEGADSDSPVSAASPSDEFRGTTNSGPVSASFLSLILFSSCPSAELRLAAVSSRSLTKIFYSL